MQRHPILSVGSNVPVAALVLFLVLIAAGCRTGTLPAGHPRFGDDGIVTAEEIERTPAQNAYEVLQWANVSASFRETHNGRLVEVSRRGGTPAVFVNGVRTEGLDMLWLIDARDIATIRMLDGVQATFLYGGQARFGAILIETKRDADWMRPTESVSAPAARAISR